ncbi:MAG: SRPBCC family protein [Planctomycetaceae bacterium]|nr:SRPBCC family protein [Planctomycetaceae bacterium]
MLFNILLVLAAAVVLLAIVLAVVIAMKPADFRITRRTTIAAPAAAVFPHVNDLSKWRAWSPWEKLDPDLKRTYEGPAAGQGASYAWSGNSKVGEGRMTITDSRASDLVRLRLEFLRPFKATNTSEFTFEPNGNQTVVTWSMDGCNSFMGKAFSLVMNMDKLIGSDFEKGLESLKAVAEAKA